MASRLREPTEQELRDLAMTLAGEIDQRRSPISDPQTRVEAANILATVVNRFSTDEPRRFGRSQVRNYDSYSDVVRNAGQYNAWMGQHVSTTRRNYDANRDFWDSAVKDFFSGELQPSAPNATHYHADFVSPDWAREYDPVAQAGPHIFYNDEAYMGRPLGQSRPSYTMAAPALAQQRPTQPNPATDFNRQEIAANAPPTPATPAQMRTARAGDPIQQRTLGAILDGTSGYTLKNSAVDVENLRPGAQSMLSLLGSASGLPELTITSGVRSPAQQAALRAQGLNAPANSRHVVGQDAIDVRGRDLTDAQKARALDVAIAGGARGIGFYNTGGRHIHFDTRDDFRSWGATPAWARQSEMFQRLQRGENPRISTMVPSPTPRPDQPVPGITPRPDPRNTDFGPLTAPNAALPTSAQRAALSSNAPARAMPVTPVASQPLPPVQSSGNARITGAFDAASRNPGGGFTGDNTARIDQGFTAANPLPTAPAFPVSSAQAYGLPAPVRSPDQFQYVTRTRQVPNPAYRAPTPQPAPADLAANYAARALGGSASRPMGPVGLGPDPVVATAPSVPNPVPPTIAQSYQVRVPVPNPVPSPRSIPSPMPRPPQLRGRESPIQQAFAGFNDWIGGRAGPIAGSVLGGLVGGPIGAVVGGFGGSAIANHMQNSGGGVQVGTLNGQNSNWSNPVFGVARGLGGTSASAHDVFYDTVYGNSNSDSWSGGSHQGHDPRTSMNATSQGYRDNLENSGGLSGFSSWW